ncbi:hypothetical protein ACVMVB_16410 [Stenotrophomonas maltophilia]
MRLIVAFQFQSSRQTRNKPKQKIEFLLIQQHESIFQRQSIHERQMNVAREKIHRYGFIHPEQFVQVRLN